MPTATMPVECREPSTKDLRHNKTLTSLGGPPTIMLQGLELHREGIQRTCQGAIKSFTTEQVLRKLVQGPLGVTGFVEVGYFLRIRLLVLGRGSAPAPPAGLRPCTPFAPWQEPETRTHEVKGCAGNPRTLASATRLHCAK